MDERTRRLALAILGILACGLTFIVGLCEALGQVPPPGLWSALGVAVGVIASVATWGMPPRGGNGHA